MNLIAVYNNDPALINSEIDTFLLARNGLSSHYQHETTNLHQTIEMIHELNKKAYAWVNRFIFEDEMESVTHQLSEMIDLNIDGFFVNDFGLLLVLRDLGFEKPISLVTNTTITNHMEVDFLVNEGFDKVLIARELTYDEIIQLASKHSSSMIVPIFGHQIISTSRRQLISAYSDLIDKSLQSDKVYRLRESTRQDYFYVLQDETGTHIFDEKVMIGFNGVKEFVSLGINDFLIDTFNLSTDQISDAASLIKQIDTNQLVSNEAIDLYLSKYPQLSMTTALWTLKTTEKKEDIA